MPFFGRKGGGAADAAASDAAGSVPGAASDASAHSNQPIFSRESAAGGSVMNIESSRSSQRPPRSLVIDRISQAGAGLARASVDLARDLAREFVEPPVQSSTLIHKHVPGGGKGGASAGDEIDAAKAAAGAADLESAPSGGDDDDDGSHTKRHGRHSHKPLTPLELESMPRGTCEDGIRRRGNTFR